MDAADQAGRRPELLLPAVHPGELPAPGGRARRGLRARGRGGHPRRRQGAGGARRRPPHQRDDHQHLLRQVGAELPRPAAAPQPVGQRGALGAAAPPVPAHHRVPLAGGPHLPRHGRGRQGLRRADPLRRLRRLHGQRAGHPGAHRAQDGRGALPRGHQHAGLRGDDGRRQGPPDGHEPRAGPELRQGLRDAVLQRDGRAGVRLADVLGRVAPGWWAA